MRVTRPYPNRDTRETHATPLRKPRLNLGPGAVRRRDRAHRPRRLRGSADARRAPGLRHRAGVARARGPPRRMGRGLRQPADHDRRPAVGRTGGRAEIRLGSTAMRIDGNTSLDMLALDDRMLQVSIEQGRAQVRTRGGQGGQAEIDTPAAAIVIIERLGRARRRRSRERAHVDPRPQGRASVHTPNDSFDLASGESTRIDADGRYYSIGRAGARDAFDQFAYTRDTRWREPRYVSAEMTGYEDLDEYGAWQPTTEYGNVWFPRAVAADWAPYRDGRWVWVEPWGWTWVDNAPWGFAPFHYGRWVQVGTRWGWWPGERVARPVYAPALVAFFGGDNFGVSVSVGAGAGGRLVPARLPRSVHPLVHDVAGVPPQRERRVRARPGRDEPGRQRQRDQRQRHDRQQLPLRAPRPSRRRHRRAAHRRSSPRNRCAPRPSRCRCSGSRARTSCVGAAPVAPERAERHRPSGPRRARAARRAQPEARRRRQRSRPPPPARFEQRQAEAGARAGQAVRGEAARAARRPPARRDAQRGARRRRARRRRPPSRRRTARCA